MPRAMSLRGESQYSALPWRTCSKAATLKRASTMALTARLRSRRESLRTVRGSAANAGFIDPPYACGGAVPPAGEINIKETRCVRQRTDRGVLERKIKARAARRGGVWWVDDPPTRTCSSVPRREPLRELACAAGRRRDDLRRGRGRAAGRGFARRCRHRGDDPRRRRHAERLGRDDGKHRHRGPPRRARARG